MPPVTEIVYLDEIPGPAGAPPRTSPRGDTGARQSDLDRLQRGVLSIGNFDGVHLGHQSLLRRLRSMADELGGPSVAIVFDPHPAEILRPDNPPPRLTTLPRRADLMSPLGIDFLLVCRTTQALLNLSPDDFFDRFILSTLAARGMVEGPNFCFGKDRRGDIPMLRQRCDKQQMQLEIVTAADDGAEMISSSRIRQCLSQSDVASAAAMLGRPHRVSGFVVTGDQRGRKIGFPTANLDQWSTMAPSPGVYSGRVELESGAQHPAAIHLGPNPTFETDMKLKFEIHVLDYSGSLYDQILAVDFIDHIRAVHSFASVDDLIAQLKRDVATTRRHYLNWMNR
ncbi:bifunctional riboflavin kinase/FAD synthetase [Crateriforma conspicua]|uniref:bifunctional riboflavin kinase/FAD synthetase n=1 Tax=Crateriforma conspicua TaxID=2527996 RepID=UPI001189A5D8|nr:bifunctional riboflavin kinase/FAD synthetase [Crateriforma conspicua]QDV65487.1 Riboflavin kinase [Crateriforma conspicua]